LNHFYTDQIIGQGYPDPVVRKNQRTQAKFPVKSTLNLSFFAKK